MARSHKTCFDTQLLHYINLGEDKKVELLLNRKLVRGYDNLGNLLHYAVVSGNATITQRLIKMGCDIDHLGQFRRSPLMLGVLYRKINTAMILVKANANIGLIDSHGKHVLQMIFDQECLPLLHSILDRLKIEAVNNEDVLVKLTSASCSLYQIVFFRDFDLIKSMLQYGVDINMQGHNGRTALHAAVEISDLTLSKWLVQNGADVNALDARGNSALFFVDTCHENCIALLQFLLEHVSDPIRARRVNECMELLLECGAIPHNAVGQPGTIFDRALMSKTPDRADSLIAQIALLGKIGKLVDKSVICCSLDEHKAKLEKLTEYYKLCEQVLDIIVFPKLSLFALLTDSDSKMKKYVRHEQFLSAIDKICSNNEIETLYPYYYNRLKKRISKAVDLVKLENSASFIVRCFFKSNYNEYYIASRKVVSYLDKYDLEQLTQI